MEMLRESRRSVTVLMALSVLVVGFVMVGGGCPPVTPPPAGGGCTSDEDCTEGQVCNVATGNCEAAPTGCTSDEDCSEGQVCNVATGACEAAPAGCTSDDDCGQGQFCDLQTGDCVLNTNLFETVTFDHGFHMGVFDCTTCHHAGLTACDACHNRDEVVNGVPVLKDAQHNPDQYGCWSCHEAGPDGTRDCSFCHTALDEQ